MNFKESVNSHILDGHARKLVCFLDVSHISTRIILCVLAFEIDRKTEIKQNR